MMYLITLLSRRINMKRYSMKDITAETVIKTREYGIRQCQACINEAVSGKVLVNDLKKYIDEF